MAAEGEVLLLRGKLHEAEQRAQEAERRATAAERERDRPMGPTTILIVSRISRELRAVSCKCANNAADHGPQVYANFARTYTVFVFNAASQRMGCLYKFFVVRCLPMGCPLTLYDFLDMTN